MVDLTDPLLWIIGGIAIAVIAFLMIFFKIFLGEGRHPHVEIFTKILRLILF